jgi:hypothetical protein
MSMKKVSTPYNSDFLKDDAYRARSVYVPDDVKRSIEKWSKDMMLDESNDENCSACNIPIPMKMITVNELNRVVSKTISEEKSIDLLRVEISKVFGPPVNTDVRLEIMAEQANDRLDVMSRTGKSVRHQIKPSILMKFSDHPSDEVRRLVVRLLPESFIDRFASDRSHTVLHEVARRLPLREVKALVKRHRGDDELETIYRSRCIAESYDEPRAGERLKGKVSSGPAIDELSDAWYQNMAQQAMSDYGVEHGGPIEISWDEIFAKRYCASLKATSGVEVDPERLWGAIQDIQKERDDLALLKNNLKDVAKKFMPESFNERATIIESLEGSNLGAKGFIDLFERAFKVKKSKVSGALYRHQISEGADGQLLIPRAALIPGKARMTPAVERVVNRFVKSWNSLQTQRGEGVRINWMPHPSNDQIITFSSEIA